MAWITILLKAIPFVMKLIQLAERAFDDIPDSGEQKKKMVMQGFQAAFDMVVGSSTGGQKETWEKLEPIISSFVDMACGFLFPNDED